MFPLLMIASRLTPVLKCLTGSNLSLEGKSKKTTKASAEKQAKDMESTNTKGEPVDFDSEQETSPEKASPEMFGGMDLNKIKSALDDDGPMGPAPQVKGGVYKQIFEVNKMMLGSLQRIESTLKLMLNLEYERALGFQQQERDENLTGGDTDPDPKKKPVGRFRRGLSAAGDMLGGAYGGLKKFGSGSIAKLLGLGVLIFAFNKYREEIIGAMAGILGYFKGVYDVFKTDGIGAAFDKVVDDFKNVFFPKIKEVSFSILDFIWSAIKGVAVDFIYRNKGDSGIRRRISGRRMECDKSDLGV